MLTLYQTEWCPYSRKVRQRLTELGLDFVAKQVPADKAKRDELQDATGTDTIPVLVTDDGEAIATEGEILAYLNERYDERPDAELHRRKLLADADLSDPRTW